MEKNQVLESFVAEITAEFPDVGRRIAQRVKSLGSDPECPMYTDLFECFSQATTDAIKSGDADTASKHLRYMSRKLDTASRVEREYIDVYYTEPLLWDIKDAKTKVWGLKLFPANIKRLYERMWGESAL